MEDNRKPFLAYLIDGRWMLVDAVNKEAAEKIARDRREVSAAWHTLQAVPLGSAEARRMLKTATAANYIGYFVQALRPPPPQTRKAVRMVTAHVLVDTADESEANDIVALHLGDLGEVKILDYTITSAPRVIDWPYKKGSS